MLSQILSMSWLILCSSPFRLRRRYSFFAFSYNYSIQIQAYLVEFDNTAILVRGKQITLHRINGLMNCLYMSTTLQRIASSLAVLTPTSPCSSLSTCSAHRSSGETMLTTLVATIHPHKHYPDLPT